MGSRALERLKLREMAPQDIALLSVDGVAGIEYERLGLIGKDAFSPFLRKTFKNLAAAYRIYVEFDKIAPRSPGRAEPPAKCRCAGRAVQNKTSRMRWRQGSVEVTLERNHGLEHQPFRRFGMKQRGANLPLALKRH